MLVEETVHVYLLTGLYLVPGSVEVGQDKIHCTEEGEGKGEEGGEEEGVRSGVQPYTLQVCITLPSAYLSEPCKNEVRV